MITLADIPLLLPDKTGEVQGWLDAYLPLETMREQATPEALASHRAKSRSGYRAGVGLPLPNYPPPPRPKINSLYWPTGASRWARGYFLATDAILDDLLAATGTTNAVKPLVLKDERSGVTITASVHMLPPRPITAVEAIEGQARKGLWLLPVVDARYYWQWKHADNFEVDNEASWDSLFSLLGTALGATVDVDPFVGDYKLPDVEELTRRYENAALLLDALAHSTGRRIVVGFDGSVKAAGVAGASGDLDSNLEEYALIAGGPIDRNLAAITPAKVLVTFPKWREHYPDPGGDLHTVEVEAETGSTAATVKVIHSSAFADFTSKNSDPDNDSDLDALAEVIAADFYASLKHFDYSLPSLSAWSPTAFDDAIEFRFGTVRDGDYEAYTRVRSRPYNSGEEEQLQQFEDMTIYPPLARFRLTENLEIGGGANALFIDGSDGETETADELIVVDTLGRAFGFGDEESGDRGWAEYKSDSLQWEVASMDGSLTRPGTAAATIAPGASGSINIGITVSAVNQSAATVESGNRIIAHYSPFNGAWYFTAAGTGEGGGGGSGIAAYRALLTASLSAQSTTASIGTITAFDGGSAPSITSVNNWFDKAGYPGDEVIFVPSPGLGGTNYTIIDVSRPDIAQVIEGYVYEAFSKEHSVFRMRIQRAYQGSMPVGGGINAGNSTLMILNWDREGVLPHDDAKPYLFEGEDGAACRAEYDPDNSKFLGLHVYRATWVECPEESPVETEGGGSYIMQPEVAGNYTYGGPSPLAAPYYGG